MLPSHPQGRLTFVKAIMPAFYAVPCIPTRMDEQQEPQQPQDPRNEAGWEPGFERNVKRDAKGHFIKGTALPWKRREQLKKPSKYEPHPTDPYRDRMGRLVFGKQSCQGVKNEKA